MLRMVETVGEVENAPILFDDFWLAYSRREAKKDAAKAWSQLSEVDQVAAIVAALEWRRIWAAQGRATHHIPLPATWLRGERFHDDIPAEFSRATAASHVAAKLPEKGERAVMPDSVRQLLAKMRAR